MKKQTKNMTSRRTQACVKADLESHLDDLQHLTGPSLSTDTGILTLKFL